MTISELVDIGLSRANASDTIIKAHAESEVALWLKDIVKQYRFDFMRKEVPTAVTISKGDNSFNLADDYWKMITIVVIDSDGNRRELELIDRAKFDQITDLTTEGLPYIACVFGSECRFYYSADKSYTIEYVYYRLFADKEVVKDADAPFTDKIIEQVAYIAALQYDRIDTVIAEGKLKRMLGDFRRGSNDEGVSGDSINLDHKTFTQRPKNFI